MSKYLCKFWTKTRGYFTSLEQLQLDTASLFKDILFQLFSALPVATDAAVRI